MLERSEIKERARNQISGNIGMLFLIGLLAGVISGVLSFAVIIVAGPIALSMAYIYRGLSRGEQPVVENLFEGFKQNFAGAIIASLLQGIYLILWSVISLGILGTVKAYAYSMTYYIMADDPNMQADQAITESRRIMDGYKFKLFVQHLSFIGWILLSMITFGIALIWVGPYMMAADYNFYLEIKGNYGEEQQN